MGDLTDGPQGFSPTEHAANRSADGSIGADGSIDTDGSIGVAGSIGAAGGVVAGGSQRNGSSCREAPGSYVGPSCGGTPHARARLERALLTGSVFTDFSCALCLFKLVSLKSEPLLSLAVRG